MKTDPNLKFNDKSIEDRIEGSGFEEHLTDEKIGLAVGAFAISYMAGSAMVEYRRQARRRVQIRPVVRNLQPQPFIVIDNTNAPNGTHPVPPPPDNLPEETTFEGQGVSSFFKHLKKDLKHVGKDIKHVGHEFVEGTKNIVAVATHSKTYPGERHALLKVMVHGIPTFKIASYMGPSTHIIERLEAHIAPVSGVDAISLVHDIRYGLAQDDVKKERYADQKFLKKLKSIKDNQFNKSQGLLIAAKIGLEEIGIMDAKQFIGKIDYTPHALHILKETLAKYEAKGY
jgi:hypothetical protein